MTNYKLDEYEFEEMLDEIRDQLFELLEIDKKHKNFIYFTLAFDVSYSLITNYKLSDIFENIDDRIKDIQIKENLKFSFEPDFGTTVITQNIDFGVSDELDDVNFNFLFDESLLQTKYKNKKSSLSNKLITKKHHKINCEKTFNDSRLYIESYTFESKEFKNIFNLYHSNTFFNESLISEIDKIVYFCFVKKYFSKKFNVDVFSEQEVKAICNKTIFHVSTENLKNAIARERIPDIILEIESFIHVKNGRITNESIEFIDNYLTLNYKV